MYYLIFGSNKILKGEVIEDKGSWFKLKEDSFNYSNRMNKWTPVSKEHIKKQSENLLDLIEVGDLVEESDFGEIYKVKVFENGKSEYRDRTFDRYNGEMYVKYEGCDDEYYSYIETLGTINISKIYKPNAKGDYIKVWEKECD